MKLITRTVVVYDYTMAKVVPGEDGNYTVEDSKVISTYEPLTNKAIRELLSSEEYEGYSCIAQTQRELKVACTIQAFMEIATPYENEITINNKEDN